MKCWIVVLLAIPGYCFSQAWQLQEVIRLDMASFQPSGASILGLKELPALLGFQRKRAIGLSLENKYSLKGMSQLNFSLSNPFSNGNMALHCSLQGSNLFTHYSTSLGYGHQLSKQTALGISFGTVRLQLKGAGPLLYVQTTGGLAYLINERTMLAIHYQYGLPIGKSNGVFNNKSEGLSLGIGYRVSRPVLIQLQLIKQENTIRLLPSINWTAHDKIDLWCGTNNSGQLTIGIQTKLKKIKTGIGLAQHPHLGYSLQLNLNKLFNDKN